ncbi:cytochrome oxidase subunit III, partial [uncultured Planktosalinus sp.]|uniref:cytochrome oxidase subunit III n=1 Tax=uncultured Planktosalinus sp. TaxID=1810935 RepID=UPI0030D93633
MEATVVKTGTEGKTWGGGENPPLKASYGKLMMWFFILSDALTFSGFLAAYGFSRYKFIDSWPVADEVFNHFPFLHGVDAPMYYVALMTFILIFSSVTMVLAVDAGHQMKKNKVVFYMFLTLIGGIIFLGSQAWEWKNFIQGTYGAVETRSGNIIQFLDADGKRVALSDIALESTQRAEHDRNSGVWYTTEETLSTYTIDDIKKGFAEKENLLVRIQKLDENGHPIVLSRQESVAKLNDSGIRVVEGANMYRNEYGHPLFGNFFFFITGFHGFHV